MQKIYQLKKLSQEFYRDYPETNFSEIESKKGRPYVVFIVKIDEHIFALPFRTNIKHKWCFKFGQTTRESKNGTGIDYSKAVIINKEIYLDKDTSIDSKEYIELDKKIFMIKKSFETYLHGYIKFIKNNDVDNNLKYKYKYTTLKYFHKELGLE